jgi:hypothetical protein
MGYLLGIEEKERDQARGESDRSNIERDPVRVCHGVYPIRATLLGELLRKVTGGSMWCSGGLMTAQGFRAPAPC